MPVSAVAGAPLVSCLMVTRNRARLARRAMACLAEQTWPALELVVVDDGEEDYGPVLDPLRRRMAVIHVRPGRAGLRLGELRNVSLDHASGEYCVQWDDDDWYHPQRVELQMAHLQSKALDAVTLEHCLWHLDAPPYGTHPFRSRSPGGAPGTLLHRRTHLRYPDLSRSEDLHFHEQLVRQVPAGCMGRDASHLYIRCYHGTNTWDRHHFERRLRRSLRDSLWYAWWRYARGNVLRHPAFRLDSREKASVGAYLDQSRGLGLLAPEP